MNVTTTKALVPTQNFIPLHESAKKVAVCLDLYPRRYRNQIVFAMRAADDLDGKYGNNGRKLVNPKLAEFVDIYI
ncbi:MAG: hypothetical protein H8D96_09835 [Desulfobacterales bacterium]|uniref:Uncharacterized protein n=1 Tax=Candidatus Desulfatibia vada TaxID=2841696 RepID=A0A8J6NTU7_9BACT|nr:hypothetical protein [Candidatus Desulfatibia vada]